MFNTEEQQNLYLQNDVNKMIYFYKLMSMAK